MKVVTLVGLLFLIACETTTPKKTVDHLRLSEPEPAVHPASEILFEKKQEAFTLTGRNVYVDLQRLLSEDCFSKSELEEIKKEVSAYLAKQGFTVVNQARKAHSDLALLCDEDSIVKSEGSAGSGPIETTEIKSSFKNGKYETETRKFYSGSGWKRFGFGWTIHEYGRREKTAFTLAVRTDKDKWERLKPEIRKRAREELSALNLRPPADNQKMAGDPACQPRMGFDAPPQSKEGKIIYVVSEVLPGSPALVAGMRVGDTVLAIDSVEYSFNSVHDSVYEEKITVPLKLLRNGKIVRSSITSKVMCP